MAACCFLSHCMFTSLIDAHMFLYSLVGVITVILKMSVNILHFVNNKFRIPHCTVIACTLQISIIFLVVKQFIVIMKYVFITLRCQISLISRPLIFCKKLGCFSCKRRKKVLHWQTHTHTHIQFQQWIVRIKFSVVPFCVYFNCNFDAFWHVSRIKAYIWDLKFSY